MNRPQLEHILRASAAIATLTAGRPKDVALVTAMVRHGLVKVVDLMRLVGEVSLASELHPDYESKVASLEDKG